MFRICAERREYLGGTALFLAAQAKQDVLGADVVMTELEGLSQRPFNDSFDLCGEGKVSGDSPLLMSSGRLKLLAYST